MRAVPFIFILILSIASSVSGALPKPRPYTGSGLLVIRPFPPATPETPCTLVLYREPGIGRIAEPSCATLPLLTPVMALPAEGFPLAVMGKKEGWLKIAYDEADREGWVEQDRNWAYHPWDDYLPGHSARLLPGLKKQWYSLRLAPSEATGEIGTLTPQETFRIDRVSDCWALVRGGTSAPGWLQWRDDSGRFLIFIEN
jgi:hypothetical protein